MGDLPMFKLTKTAVVIAFSIAIDAAIVDRASATSLDTVLARLNTLEKENQTLRDRVRRLETSGRIVAGAAPASIKPSVLATTNARLATNAASSLLPAERQPGWAGIYWGASFGGALTRAQTSSVETYISAFPSNGFPFSTQGIMTTAQGSGSNGLGATLDLFAGFNTQLDRVVAGVQLEGSLADINFKSPGTRSYVYFNGAGPTGQTASGSFQPHVYGRWMVSALARGGFLVDPSTLFYGIGGWTFGRFEYHNVTDNLFFQPGETFYAHGVTGGAGIERKLDDNWSVRAEYRFTHFLPTTVGSVFSWASAGAPFAGTQSQTMQTRFANDMHVFRLGISRLSSMP
jgi:outer membrane immunogenic protein